MQPIVKFGLTKDDISSTRHTAVRYGPRSLGGIQLLIPNIIQRSGQIDFLVKHCMKLNPYIPLLRANIFNIQLESG